MVAFKLRNPRRNNIFEVTLTSRRRSLFGFWATFIEQFGHTSPERRVLLAIANCRVFTDTDKLTAENDTLIFIPSLASAHDERCDDETTKTEMKLGRESADSIPPTLDLARITKISTLQRTTHVLDVGFLNGFLNWILTQNPVEKSVNGFSNPLTESGGST